MDCLTSTQKRKKTYFLWPNLCLQSFFLLNSLFYTPEYIIKTFASIYEELYAHIVNKHEHSHHTSGKDILWH